MLSNTRSLLILALGILLGAALTVGHSVFGASDSENKKVLSGESVPVEELRNFVEILNRVKQGYVEEVSDETLLENAIRGMLDGLDPHSAYLSRDEYKELSISTSGKFGGLGIEVTTENGFVRVVAPIDDTPAKRAGIESGDLIVRIDDKSVKGLSLMDAVKKMRGDPGSHVTLTVLRESRDEPFKVKIERAIIRVESVKARMLEPGYGYVRISQFSNRTGESLDTAIEDLMAQADGQFNGLVLDLRNNPGGVLDAAVDVADSFMHDGQIVSVKGRAENTDQSFSASSGDVLDGRPIVVLINEGSASASEIVAGALQDSGRAVIIGRQTFGKGSVQTILPLQSEAALKLTTARYYTPSGRSIQAEGITPDVRVQDVKVSAVKGSDVMPFSEADLVGALPNGKAPPTTTESTNTDGGEDDEQQGKPLAAEDYPLYEALNLLKGLYILSKR